MAPHPLPETTVKTQFDTSPFVRCHAKQPRGTGMWAFGLTPDADTFDCIFTPYCLSCSEAKKWVAATFPKVRTFYVMS